MGRGAMFFQMSKQHIKIFLKAGGQTLSYLHTERLNLDRFGRKNVQRASDVEFNHETQQWDARLNNGEVIASDASRDAVLQMEREHIDFLLESEGRIPCCT